MGAPWKLLIDTFKGVATLLDDVILGKSFAKEATNLILTQDGRWKTAWGVAHYGSSITGETKIYGAGKYIKSDGTQEKIVICSSGKAYKSVDDGSWTEITGATFSTTETRYCFLQTDSMLFIANGIDKLTRYNGTNLVRYTEISAPTGLSGTRNVLTAGTNHNYYKVTALNNVGETVGSAEIDVTTNKERNSWITSSNERIDLTWNAVSGATRYQIYYSDTSGKEMLLAENYSITTSYQDDGTAVINPYAPVPEENSTGAPAFKWMSDSDNRIWGITDDTIWWSGTGVYFGYFGSTYGGGYQPLTKGGGETLEWIGHFRNGKGDNVPTVLARNKEGVGSVWHSPLTSFQIGDYVIVAPVVTKLPGPMGTVAPLGVVEAKDSLFMPNSRGLFVLNNKENIQNILSTDEVSGNIRPSFRGIVNKENIAGIWYDSKVIFTASEGGNGNDIMFMYDTELREWVWKWTIGFRHFLEVTEADGTTRLLGVPNTGNQLSEISPSIKGHYGQGFYQAWTSGLIPVSEDSLGFALVKEAMVELGRSVGTLYFEVLGVEAKRGFRSIASRQITDSVSNIDFTNGLWGEYLWGEDEEVPIVYSSASDKKIKKVGKVLNAIQFRVFSNSADTEFTILKIEANGKMKKVRPPRVWYN